ncbi:MAG: KH domain-containing protein [Clostridiales bacterium]|nr:KH domain-containing protein [Clostridiales bacterium]
MTELVDFIVRQLSQHPDKINVSSSQTENDVTVTVRAADEDLGKIIGKQGRIAKAIRTIVKAATSSENKKYYVEIKSIDEK